MKNKETEAEAALNMPKRQRNWPCIMGRVEEDGWCLPSWSEWLVLILTMFKATAIWEGSREEFPKFTLRPKWAMCNGRRCMSCEFKAGTEHNLTNHLDVAGSFCPGTVGQEGCCDTPGKYMGRVQMGEPWNWTENGGSGQDDERGSCKNGPWVSLHHMPYRGGCRWPNTGLRTPGIQP